MDVKGTMMNADFWDIMTYEYKLKEHITKVPLVREDVLDTILLGLDKNSRPVKMSTSLDSAF